MFSSVTDAKKILSELKKSLEREDGCTDFEVFRLIDMLYQIIDIIAAVNKKDRLLTPEEISETGKQGLSLIDNLVDKLMTKDQISLKQEAEQLALFLANWVIKHKGVLINIQSLVDGLAYLSNQVEDQVSLLQLSTFMGQVADACSDIIQHDLEDADPSRPWRTLNMNRGIVATRTHDLEVMKSVFTDLIKAIPLDAPMFFEEGMSEMTRRNYPDQVQELMQSFYEEAQLPVLH